MVVETIPAPRPPIRLEFTVEGDNADACFDAAVEWVHVLAAAGPASGEQETTDDASASSPDDTLGDGVSPSNDEATGYVESGDTTTAE